MIKKKSNSGDMSVEWRSALRPNQCPTSSVTQGHHVPSSEHLAQSAQHAAAWPASEVQGSECTLEGAQLRHQISDVCHSTDYISEED